jgi:hypothetical protein
VALFSVLLLHTLEPMPSDYWNIVRQISGDAHHVWNTIVLRGGEWANTDYLSQLQSLADTEQIHLNALARKGVVVNVQNRAYF